MHKHNYNRVNTHLPKGRGVRAPLAPDPPMAIVAGANVGSPMKYTKSHCDDDKTMTEL